METINYIQMDSVFGLGTKIWKYTNIYDSEIGDNCSIGSYTEIGNAKIGNNVRIGAYCFLCKGVEIEDDVFLAPRVTFLHDKYPPSGGEYWGKILVKKGAVIGGNATVLPNVTIGKNAVIGAGSVVTKDVAEGITVIGNPARVL